jgi:polar amino acid transport system substrate-binding protein
MAFGVGPPGCGHDLFVTVGGFRALVAFGMALLLALASGCQYPRDPEETLDRVSGGTMYVGVIDDPPWVVLDEGKEPQGVEPELVRGFAEQIAADVEWVEGPEEELMEAMRGFQLDIVIGGLTRSSPYRNEVALTRPYIDTEIEFGVPPGDDEPNDLDEIEVWVERNSVAAALLQQEEGEANPLYYESLDQVNGLALLHDYEIEAIGYARTDRIQRDEEHAMAVPMGENAFLVELEHYLLDRGQEAEELLDREAGEQFGPEASP